METTWCHTNRKCPKTPGADGKTPAVRGESVDSLSLSLESLSILSIFSQLLYNFHVNLFQNDVKTLKKWMADVDIFLNEEWPALGDSEALEKQLEQCTVGKPFIQVVILILKY